MNKTKGNMVFSNYIILFTILFGVLSIAVIFAAISSHDFGHASVLVGAAGALATASGVSGAIGIYQRQEEYNRSKFYMGSITGNIHKAHDLLKNNDRVTWILAARILAESELLFKNISEPDHRVIFNGFLDAMRPSFSAMLKSDERNASAYFMGSKDPYESINIAQERQEDNYEILYIPESAISVVMRYADFPDNYEDHLPSRLDAHQEKRARFFYYSLWQYVKFSRKNPPISKAFVHMEEMD